MSSPFGIAASMRFARDSIGIRLRLQRTESVIFCSGKDRFAHEKTRDLAAVSDRRDVATGVDEPTHRIPRVCRRRAGVIISFTVDEAITRPLRSATSHAATSRALDTSAPAPQYKRALLRIAIGAPFGFVKRRYPTACEVFDSPTSAVSCSRAGSMTNPLRTAK